MNKRSIPEELQRSKFTEFYLNDNEYFFLEVPVFCRSVDLVKQNKLDNTITAIEFKMGDWKRALNQVMGVALCFDYLAICIPKPKTEKCQKVICNECTTKGIGLYFYNEKDDTFDHIVYGQQVGIIWETQREQVVRYLGGNSKWIKH